MEKWEALMVRVVQLDGRGEITTTGPDGDQKLIDHQDASINRAMRFLAELGEDGWQLVSTEHFEKVRVFWMRRPKPEGPTESWAFGV